MEEHKFLKTEGRGLAHALAYHPQFKLFDRYWVAVTDDIAAQKEAAKMSTRAHQGGTRHH